jgi:hypothetical protein
VSTRASGAEEQGSGAVIETAPGPVTWPNAPGADRLVQESTVRAVLHPPHHGVTVSLTAFQSFRSPYSDHDRLGVRSASPIPYVRSAVRWSRFAFTRAKPQLNATCFSSTTRCRPWIERQLSEALVTGLQARALQVRRSRVLGEHPVSLDAAAPGDPADHSPAPRRWRRQPDLPCLPHQAHSRSSPAH